MASTPFPHLVNLFGDLIVALLISFAKSPEDSLQLRFFGLRQLGECRSRLRFESQHLSIITKAIRTPTHTHTHTHTGDTAIESQGSRGRLPPGTRGGALGLAFVSDTSSSVSPAESGSGLVSWYDNSSSDRV